MDKEVNRNPLFVFLAICPGSPGSAISEGVVATVQKSMSQWSESNYSHN